MFKSAYQVAREANIKRNLEELRALGLISANDTEDTDLITKRPTNKKAKTGTRPVIKKEPRVGSRQSRRIRNLEVERQPLGEPQLAIDNLKRKRIKFEHESGDESESFDERMRRVTMERKIERLKQLHQEQKTAYKNPTATYEHTWFRVRTMTPKALLNRVRAIERACGAHCLVKMRMFTEVLILAGMDDLAQEAQEAYDRLQALATSS